MRWHFSLLVVVWILSGIVCTTKTGELKASGSGDCYDDYFKMKIKNGEAVKPKAECLRLLCINGHISVESCQFIVLPGCDIIPGDPLKPFPSCCPTHKCANSLNVHHAI